MNCKPSYISQVKKDAKYIKLFKSDGSPTTDGQDFINKHKSTLDSFYHKHGL